MWDDRIAQSRDEGSDGGGAYLADARADRDPVGIDPAATPLYLAVTHRTPLYSPDEPECEHLDCIRVLIEAGAIADWADSEGGTPLMAAAAWPWPPVIQLLLTAGADPNRRHKMSGWTPLMFVLYPLPSWPVDGVYHSRAYPRLSGCADPTVQAKGVRLLLDAGPTQLPGTSTVARCPV